MAGSNRARALFAPWKVLGTDKEDSGMKTKLIKTVADKAEATGDADLWIWDTELDGFALRVKPSGRKIYVLRYRTKAGIQRKQNIAKSTEVPPDKARGR